MSESFPTEFAPADRKCGLAVRCSSSIVVPAPLSEVWSLLRDFTFPARILPDVVESCTMEDDASPYTVGGVREMKWKSGESLKHQLLALDDLEYKASWEVISTSVPTEASAIVSHLKCHSISQTNETYVQWTTEFSADVDGKVLSYHQEGNQKTLQDVVSYFAKRLKSKTAQKVTDDVACNTIPVSENEVLTN